MLKLKKGNLLDWFYIIPIVFLIVLVCVVSLHITNKVDDTNIFSEDANAEANIQKSKTTLLLFDNLIMFIVLGLSIFVLVSSYFVWNHPVFFFVGVILLAVAITLAALFANSYEQVTGNEHLASDAEQFTKMNFMMDKFPIYILFMGLMTLVVMGVSYGRSYG